LNLLACQGQFHQAAQAGVASSTVNVFVAGSLHPFAVIAKKSLPDNAPILLLFAPILLFSQPTRRKAGWNNGYGRPPPIAVFLNKV
jgi:hypothetical protein